MGFLLLVRALPVTLERTSHHLLLCTYLPRFAACPFCWHKPNHWGHAGSDYTDVIDMTRDLSEHIETAYGCAPFALHVV